MSDATNLAAQLRAMGTSNVVPDLKQMDALLISAADEIEGNRAALKVAQQSLLEFSHAQECGPSWYTRGTNGMYQQVSLWFDRGLKVVQDALGPYDDNGQYLKEMPAGEQKGVLTITRDVTTVSPNFRVTVSKPDSSQLAIDHLAKCADDALVTMFTPVPPAFRGCHGQAAASLAEVLRHVRPLVEEVKKHRPQSKSADESA